MKMYISVPELYGLGLCSLFGLAVRAVGYECDYHSSIVSDWDVLDLLVSVFFIILSRGIRTSWVRLLN